MNIFAHILAAYAAFVLFPILTYCQELKSPLLFDYQVVELPESVEQWDIVDAELLENGAIIIRTFDSSFYRNSAEEWFSPLSAFDWTVAASGVVGGFDQESSQPAIWRPEEPGEEYVVIDKSDFTPLGISNNGTMLLLEGNAANFHVWSNGSLHSVAESYPSLGSLSQGLRYMLPDGALYGFTKPIPTSFSPFKFSQGILTVYDSISLSTFQILNINGRSPQGNVFSQSDEASSISLWGPAFDGVVFIEGFLAEAINDNGEMVGSESGGPSTVLDRAMYWNAQDGYHDLDTIILLGSDETEVPHFHQSVSINNDRSLLAFGFVENGFIRESKLFLLTQQPALNRIDIQVDFESASQANLIVLPHFRTASLALEGSADMTNWEPIQVESTTNVGPRFFVELAVKNFPRFLRVNATPE